MQFRGKEVSTTAGLILDHVVNKLHDHFKGNKMPNVTFECDSLSRLPSDEAYRSKREGPADKWYCEISMNYSVNGNVLNGAVVALDGVYIDLMDKISSKGSPATNYGRTWINLYVPYDVTAKSLSKFCEDTGWDVCATTAINDERQAVRSFTVNLADDDGLGFYTIRKGATHIMKKRVGSVQDAFSTPNLKHILNCTAYVTMSMVVNTPVGTAQAPDPAGDFKAKVRLCLVGVDAFGISKGITPVQFSRGKKDRFMR